MRRSVVDGAMPVDGVALQDRPIAGVSGFRRRGAKQDGATRPSLRPAGRQAAGGTKAA